MTELATAARRWPRRCPKCGGPVLRIFYGQPESRDGDLRKFFVVEEVTPRATSPAWACFTCGHRWGRLTRCPSCGSFATGLITFGMPLERPWPGDLAEWGLVDHLGCMVPLERFKWTCHSCEHRWGTRQGL